MIKLRYFIILISIICFIKNETTYEWLNDVSSSLNETCFNICLCSSDLSKISCQNFTQLDELNFDQNKSTNVQYLFLRPIDKIIFDSSLNLTGTYFGINSSIVLKNFDGFDLSADPFVILSELPGRVIIIDESNINFVNHKTSFFSKFSVIVFYKNNKYLNEISTMVFKNTKNTRIIFYNLTHDNMFQIIQNQSINTQNADIGINRIDFIDSQIDQLNHSILNKYLLDDLNYLILTNSSLNSIDENLFIYTKELKNFSLNLVNFDQFITSSQNEWMKHLSNAKNASESDENYLFLELNDQKNEYEFLEKDFCHFRYFPYTKYVFPIINTRPTLGCGCTLVYLMFERYIYDIDDLIRTPSIQECLRIDFINFKELTENCDFNLRNKNCDSISNVSSSTLESTKTIKTTASTSTEEIGIYTTTFLLTTSSALVQETSENPTSSKNNLVTILSIVLTVVSLAFLVLFILTLILFIRYKNLRSFKSEVAYEISTYTDSMCDD